MKQKLPLVLLVFGVIVLMVGFFLVRNKNNTKVVQEEVVLKEVALGDRPIASLTPSKDGHWLKLKVNKIVIDALTLDYELLYKLPDGRTQGVPGSVKLNGQSLIERELLLGSESSGKFRYDEGVEGGTLSLRFRDAKGKLIAKLSTEFALLSDNKLSSVDGLFKYNVSKTTSDFFVVMQTFGLEELPASQVVFGPYGVFSATGDAKGSPSGFSNILFWNGTSWTAPTNSTPEGIFVGTN